MIFETHIKLSLHVILLDTAVSHQWRTFGLGFDRSIMRTDMINPYTDEGKACVGHFPAIIEDDARLSETRSDASKRPINQGFVLLQ